MSIETMKHLTLDMNEGIATLTFNRPEKMNALTSEMWVQLREAVEDVGHDDSVNVLLVTGSGKAFCAGSDVVSRLGARIGGEQQETTRQEKLEPLGYVGYALQSMSKPVIAAINGVAAGAGLSIALLCDIRIASDKARFAASWSKVGLIPDLGATKLLPQTIGIDRAFELMLTGDVIDAGEAARIGLVTKVVPHDEVCSASLELARRLAMGPSIAMTLIKRAIYRGSQSTLDAQLEFETYAQNVCRGTADHREGVLAFQERRPPRFRGL